MSIDYAGRLRTSTDTRHDLQGERCLLRGLTGTGRIRPGLDQAFAAVRSGGTPQPSSPQPRWGSCGIPSTVPVRRGHAPAFKVQRRSAVGRSRAGQRSGVVRARPTQTASGCGQR